MVNDKAVIAANRFGLGARPGELERITEEPEGWLVQQLDESRSAGPMPRLPSSSQVLRDLTKRRAAIREARQAGEANEAMEAQRSFRRFIGEHYREQATHRYDFAATTDTPFRERLVHFWSNHFAVSADKQPVGALAGTLENEVIRPHVTGRFEDMLVAVEKHPAMIIYLDNQTSMGPNSPLARAAARRGRALGLNENLAREILELHTLGVDGGYSQEDVTTFANVITGWSVGGGPERLQSGAVGEFQFRSGMHEPGPKTVLGKRYGEDGMAQGEAVLKDLAAHPRTARFLAEKLARHFVADEPPPRLVDALSAVYLKTSGDLGEVCSALVRAREPWVHPLTKYKTPQDFVISTYRAMGQRPDNPHRMLAFLTLLGQRPYTPGSPAGWPDTASHWDGGDALIKRIQWVAAVGRTVADRADPLVLGNAILGSVLADHSRTAISRAESASQGLTLLLASPEFQRR